MVRSRLLCAALAIPVAFTLTACGSSPTASSSKDSGPTKAEKVYSQLEGLTGKERRDKLVKMAQEEGQLDLYTSMTSDVADEVSEQFSDAFDVDVNLYRANGETVVQRILQEQAAHYAGNDVVETDGIELAALEKEKLMAPYRSERRDLVPEQGQFDTWTATRFNVFAPSWNTKKVSPAEAPTSWEDLADPKWDGQLAMELGDVDWYLTLYEYWLDQGKSEAEVDKLFHDMADGTKVVKGHTVQAQLLSAGQFSVVASNYSYITQQAKDRGAPVDYLPFVEPAIARPNGVGLMKTAKHPAAALLFVDWLLDEGQKVIADQGLTPAIVEGNDPLKGVKVIPVDIDKVINEDEKWSKKYDDLLSGAEEVGD